MAQTLAEKAYQRIKKLIISNDYPPGTSLQEPELVRKLGMSRTPIREALRKLEREKLVEIIPQKGAFVSGISPERLKEIFQIREIIEPKAAEIAASSISLSKLREIKKELLNLRNKEVEDISYTKSYELDRKLHNLIISTVGNKLMIEILESLKVDIRRACHFAMAKSRNIQKFIDEHLEIIEALETRDGNKVAQAMLKHIKSVKASILS
ncbi:GntR family transcriptional regulator [Candidatus Aerophobetes bacterium]|nr:GntR family transcriptional regulator [Candidatus Aerophobetes bacterium]